MPFPANTSPLLLASRARTCWEHQYHSPWASPRMLRMQSPLTLVTVYIQLDCDGFCPNCTDLDNSAPTSNASAMSLIAVPPDTTHRVYADQVADGTTSYLTTRGPSLLPTVTPSSAPTLSPTQPPTAPPTSTPPPSTPPSKLDRKEPRKSFHNLQTKGPSPSPTNVPTSPPTSPPTSLPTFQPTKPRSSSPPKVPTAPPSKSPTKAPTSFHRQKAQRLLQVSHQPRCQDTLSGLFQQQIARR